MFGVFKKNTNLVISLNLVADKGKETVSIHTIFQLVKASHLILYRILTEKIKTCLSDISPEKHPKWEKQVLAELLVKGANWDKIAS